MSTSVCRILSSMAMDGRASAGLSGDGERNRIERTKGECSATLQASRMLLTPLKLIRHTRCRSHPQPNSVTKRSERPPARHHRAWGEEGLQPLLLPGSALQHTRSNHGGHSSDAEEPRPSAGSHRLGSLVRSSISMLPRIQAERWPFNCNCRLEPFVPAINARSAPAATALRSSCSPC